MNIEEIKQKILTEDEFVLQEIDRLQYLYKLKEEIRYDLKREEEVVSESVAEHVYGMQVCANYFLALEDTHQEWNHLKIMKMILWHDIDEIITGDTIGYLKTAEHRKREAEATRAVIQQLTPVIQSEVSDLVNEYEAKETTEAKFVKGIDKIETIIQCFNENGKQTLRNKHTTLEQHKSIKEPYVKDFPIMKRFNEVATAEMVQQGFYDE